MRFNFFVYIWRRLECRWDGKERRQREREQVRIIDGFPHFILSGCLVYIVFIQFIYYCYKCCCMSITNIRLHFQQEKVLLDFVWMEFEYEKKKKRNHSNSWPYYQYIMGLYVVQLTYIIKYLPYDFAMALVFLPFVWSVFFFSISDSCSFEFYSLWARSACALVHYVWSGSFNTQIPWCHPFGFSRTEWPNSPKIRGVHLIEFGHVIHTIWPYAKCYRFILHIFVFLATSALTLSLSNTLFVQIAMRTFWLCIYAFMSSIIWFTT